MRQPHWRWLHDQQSDLRPLHVQLQPRSVRKARLDRATGAVRRASRDVVAVFSLAVAARSIRAPRRDSTDAGYAVPAARRAGRVRPLEARSEVLHVFRPADVHGDDRADLLHEFQVRVIASAGARRQRAARSARSRLFLSLELLGVERLGRAGSRLRVGDDCGVARLGKGESRWRDSGAPDASQLARRDAGSRPGAHSAVCQLEIRLQVGAD